jgi:hypothetical protein
MIIIIIVSSSSSVSTVITTSIYSVSIREPLMEKRDFCSSSVLQYRNIPTAKAHLHRFESLQTGL